MNKNFANALVEIIPTQLYCLELAYQRQLAVIAKMQSIKAYKYETIGPVTMPGISKELPNLTLNRQKIIDQFKKLDLSLSCKLILLQ